MSERMDYDLSEEVNQIVHLLEEKISKMDEEELEEDAPKGRGVPFAQYYRNHGCRGLAQLLKYAAVRAKLHHLFSDQVDNEIRYLVIDLVGELDLTTHDLIEIREHLLDF